MHFGSKILVTAVLAFAATPAAFAESLADVIRQGCSAEISQYCSQVLEGEGRLLACFYAHEDKLSNQCMAVLYNSAEALVDAVDALEDVAEDCGDDIVKFCGSVEPGEGRILNCLAENAEDLSMDCKGELAELAE